MLDKGRLALVLICEGAGNSIARWNHLFYQRLILSTDSLRFHYIDEVFNSNTCQLKSRVVSQFPKVKERLEAGNDDTDKASQLSSPLRPCLGSVFQIPGLALSLTWLRQEPWWSRTEIMYRIWCDAWRVKGTYVRPLVILASLKETNNRVAEISPTFSQNVNYNVNYV